VSQAGESGSCLTPARCSARRADGILCSGARSE